MKVDHMFKIDFIALNESRKFWLQFATDRIKIGPLEPEIQPAKGARRHFAGPMTSLDIMGLPPIPISLVTLYNCLLTVEKISGTQLPYRRCERRIFFINISFYDGSAGVLLPFSPVK